MTTSEVIAVLRSEGFVDVSEWRLNRAIRLGKIPKPTINLSLRFSWDRRGLSAARSYFKANPKREYRLKAKSQKVIAAKDGA